jgi:hypothetical protein
MTIKKVKERVEQLAKDMKEFAETGKIEHIHQNHKENK